MRHSISSDRHWWTLQPSLDDEQNQTLKIETFHFSLGELEIQRCHRVYFQTQADNTFSWCFGDFTDQARATKQMTTCCGHNFTVRYTLQLVMIQNIHNVALHSDQHIPSQTPNHTGATKNASRLTDAQSWRAIANMLWVLLVQNLKQLFIILVANCLCAIEYNRICFINTCHTAIAFLK